MRCITVQNKNVLDVLLSTGVYCASEDRVSRNLLEPYRFMQKVYRFSNSPIFLAPVGYYCNFYGAKFDNNSIAIELDVPDELCRVQEYYDWSDFIYFMEFPNEFSVSVDIKLYATIEEYGKHILTKLNVQGLYEDIDKVYQITVSEIRKEWVLMYTSDLAKLQSMHDGSYKKPLSELIAYETTHVMKLF